MKKLALATLALTCAAGAFAQGTVAFNNRLTGTLITHVYAPLAGQQSKIGNGSNDTPSSTTDWSGWTALSGGTWFAQLLAANGAGQAESSLSPQGATTTFRTGGAAGNVAVTTATLGNVPKDSAAATLELVAWDNSSGLYSTWAQASVAWAANLISAGKSGTFTVNAIGGDVNTPPALTGLQSFSLSSVPEPTSFALVGMGAAAMMIFRRRKN